jgi:ATP-binding protein involved in chromosome partitioning
MSVEQVALIRDALKKVKYPGFSRDIVSFGFVKNISFLEGKVQIELSLSNPSDAVKTEVQTSIKTVISSLEGVKEVLITITEPVKQATPHQHQASSDPWAEQSKIPGIKNIVAVASGKGGVGKSTVSVNIACALSQLGYKVGILDCDIYGPSLPTMMGTKEQPELAGEELLSPVFKYGIALMSIGFLLDEDEPVIWRGPMIQSAIKQFLKGVRWGELDFLVVDLPPGTGDAQLSLAQMVPITGTIIVTTPQDVALIDAKKGVGMFKKINVPVLGIIENMSYFLCPHCQKRTDIFSNGGGRKEAERQDVDFLGEVPLDPEIRKNGDEGKPIVIANPDSPQSRTLLEIAQLIANKLEQKF